MLPLELWLHVCSFLPAIDILVVRCVARNFTDRLFLNVAAQHFQASMVHLMALAVDSPDNFFAIMRKLKKHTLNVVVTGTAVLKALTGASWPCDSVCVYCTTDAIDDFLSEWETLHTPWAATQWRQTPSAHTVSELSWCTTKPLPVLCHVEAPEDLVWHVARTQLSVLCNYYDGKDFYVGFPTHISLRRAFHLGDHQVNGQCVSLLTSRGYSVKCPSID